MRLPALPLIVLAVIAAPVTAQKSTSAVPAKITLLGEVRDSVCDEVSISPNERFVACATLKPDFRIIDLSTHKTSVLFKGMFAEDLVWSKAGDRVAFSGLEEGGKDGHVWTAGVDSRTGQQTTPPRRVSASPGGMPAYSPDGQFIAYSQDAGKNNRKLVVVPANGGAERILAEGDIFGPYAWSSDAKWIYFPKFNGLRSADSAYSIFRVPAAAGPSERVSDYRSIDKRGSWFYHGASRDGRFIAIGTRSMNGNQLKAVLDPQGKLLGVATLPGDLREGTSSDYDWMPSGSRLFLTTKNRPTVLRSLTVADGSARDLVSSSERPRNPSFSSDGRWIAVQAWNGSRFDIAIMNADGTGKKFLNTASEPRANLVVASWSPDNRYIAYVEALGRALHVVDVQSGKDTRLATAEVLIPTVRWSRDSRSLRFIAVNRGPQDPQNSFRIVGLDGRERVVRDVGGGPPAYLFISDDSVLKVQDGMLIPFGPGAARQIHAPTNIRPKPGVSRDGRWIAFMPNGIGSGGQPSVYEMISTDSPSRLVVHLPPGVQSTAPLVSLDNRSLIVPTPGLADQPARILLVPVNGDPPRTLATLPARQQLVSLTVNPDWYFDAAISPDGKTLLYSAASPPVQQFFSVDLSPALTTTQAGKPGAP